MLDVRAVARIVVDSGTTAPPYTSLVYSVQAFDAAGVALEVGEDAAITWTFGGSLGPRNYPGCGDILPVCPAHNAGFAWSLGAGVGTIDVAFAGRTVSNRVTIGP